MPNTLHNASIGLLVCPIAHLADDMVDACNAVDAALLDLSII
jgi:hypothetical protein